MVPPMMVTSTTVLTPDLLRVPMKWVFSTVKVTTAVSPALMLVLSSVMVAMGLSFQWDVDCAGAPHSGRRAAVTALSFSRNGFKGLIWARSSLAALASRGEGFSDARYPPGRVTTTCTVDIRRTNPIRLNIAHWKPNNLMCWSVFAEIRHHRL